MTKVVIFAFRSDPLCFSHVLLNVLDMEDKGMWGEIVLEGEATKLVPIMAEEGHFLNQMYQLARGKGLFWGACRACATKMGVVEEIEAEQIPLQGDMSGHPPMSHFFKEGYTILTF